MSSSDASTADSSSKGGVVLAILAAAMFVYVIDTTLMNVSISALVEDLNTTVGAVQGAITLYTLTMAAFMLAGGKLGDIWGSKRRSRSSTTGPCAASRERSWSVDWSRSSELWSRSASPRRSWKPTLVNRATSRPATRWRRRCATPPCPASTWRWTT